TACAGEATVRQVAAMLGFLFSMEGLALSLGCDRTQLELAAAQSHPEEPSKAALLWAAQVQLAPPSPPDLPTPSDQLPRNPLALSVYPRYLSGFVHALEPVPGLTDFVVEAISNAFARLPDPVLLPWLPILISTLRSGGAELAPLLAREAGRIFPGRLAALDEWVPPWRPQAEPEAVRAARRMGGGRGVALLTAHPATCDAAAMLLGCDGTWETADPGQAGAALVTR